MQGDWDTSADDFRHHEVDPGANRASCRLPGRPAAKEEARYAACYRIAVVSTAPLMPGTYSCLSGTRTCSWQMRSQPEQTRRDVSTAVISACSALHDLAATEGCLMFGGCLLPFTHFSVIFFTVRSFHVRRRSYL